MTPGTIPMLKAKPVGGGTTPPVEPEPSTGSTLVDIITQAGVSTGLKIALDAGASASYDGGSQTWTSLIAGTTDMILGSSSDVDSTDPTFVGVVNGRNSTTYFETDGSDQFSATASGNWYGAFMKTTKMPSGFSDTAAPTDELAAWAVWFYAPTNTAENNNIMDCTTYSRGTFSNDNNQFGFRFYINTAGRVVVDIANGLYTSSGSGTTAITGTSTNAVLQNAWNCLIVRKNNIMNGGSTSAGARAAYINLNGTETAINRPAFSGGNSISASVSNPLYMLKAGNTPTSTSRATCVGAPAGLRIMAVAYWDTFISATQANSVRTTFATERGI